MLAIIAALLFLLFAVGITALGPVGLLGLGLCLLAIHLAFPIALPALRRG